jgi:hypothetical protein
VKDDQATRPKSTGSIDITGLKNAEADPSNQELATLNRVGLTISRLIVRGNRAIYRLRWKSCGSTASTAMADEGQRELWFPETTDGQRELFWRGPGNGLTEHVIRTGWPLLLARDVDAEALDGN